ncbi:hypothetical protein [Sutcliffiella rhizosphaerae]|uniref:hypothetical protein n=1 Tax=Sutcliffiella rhizosphaerae TaxID=2880967 RepID=UPI001E6062B9|nr:hypothetical protein [Sutcliffiella rhizosphaerae]
MNNVKDKFEFTHNNYISSLNNAWRNNKPELIYDFLSSKYKGTIFSQKYDPLILNKKGFIKNTSNAINSSWNPNVFWFFKNREIFINGTNDLALVTYNLVLEYPSNPVHIGIAKMVEVWIKFKGKWLLIRETQEERDDDFQVTSKDLIEKVINQDFDIRVASKSINMNALNKITSNEYNICIYIDNLPFLSTNFDLSKIKLCLNNIKKYHFLFKNKNEVVITQIFYSDEKYKNDIYYGIVTEVWKYKAAGWFPVRSHHEYISR